MQTIPKDEEIEVFESFNELYGLPYGSRYVPAPLPVSLTRNGLCEIRRSPGNYLCSLKNDGERHLLLFSNSEKTDQNFVALITRKGHINFCAFWDPDVADGPLLDGTLLDGELMKDGSFVVFDSVAVTGYDCKPLVFSKRLDAATKYVEKMNKLFRLANVKNMNAVRAKKWVHPHKIRSLLQRGVLPEHNDGLIIVHDNSPYGRNRTHSIMKWKPSHTVDLLVKQNQAFTQSDSGKVVLMKNVEVVNADGPHEGKVCECEILRASVFDFDKLRENPYEASFRCHIKCIRSDKCQPNHVSTITRSIHSTRENITLHELMSL